MRPSYFDLKDVVEHLDKQKRGIYVQSPVGVGKSYLLYLLAAEYRLNHKTHRVTYINDCAEWKEDPYLYLLHELLTTFHRDSLGKLFKQVTENEKEDKIMALVRALIDHVNQQNLQWVIICDQHNSLYDDYTQNKFPFRFLGFLLGKRRKNIKIIISASANNEGYPFKMKDCQCHDISNHRFSDDEFEEWCHHYPIKGCVIDHKSAEAADALFWTGGIPYELDLLWNQTGDTTLFEKTLAYRASRVTSMQFHHSKFFEKLPEGMKRNLLKCVAHMALDIAPPVGIIGMDRQLFDIIVNDQGRTIITALNPVARYALFLYHGEGFFDSLTLVVEIVLRDDYANDVKGRIVEKYIMVVLQVSKRFSFTFREAKTSSLSTKVSAQAIKIEDVIRFSGNGLPIARLFNCKLSTLFVPKSPNYPGYDFFIWDHIRQKLMAFQVTVLNPFSNHSKASAASENCQLWLDFCYGTSKQNPIEIYWIIPKGCVGRPKNLNKCRVILMDDLHSDFPGLKCLTLE